MILGLMLDPQNYHRELDIGPSGDEKKESTQFRGFWGSDIV